MTRASPRLASPPPVVKMLLGLFSWRGGDNLNSSSALSVTDDEAHDVALDEEEDAVITDESDDGNDDGDDDSEYSASVSIAGPLTSRILSKSPEYTYENMEKQLNAKNKIHLKRKREIEEVNIKRRVSDQLKWAMELHKDKGGYNWLTALPLQEHSFTLHKGVFKDALSELIMAHCNFYPQHYLLFKL